LVLLDLGLSPLIFFEFGSFFSVFLVVVVVVRQLVRAAIGQWSQFLTNICIQIIITDDLIFSCRLAGWLENGSWKGRYYSAGEVDSVEIQWKFVSGSVEIRVRFSKDPVAVRLTGWIQWKFGSGSVRIRLRIGSVYIRLRIEFLVKVVCSVRFAFGCGLVQFTSGCGLVLFQLKSNMTHCSTALPKLRRFVLAWARRPVWRLVVVRRSRWAEPDSWTGRAIELRKFVLEKTKNVLKKPAHMQYLTIFSRPGALRGHSQHVGDVFTCIWCVFLIRI